jgi:hypothetical protein
MIPADLDPVGCLVGALILALYLGVATLLGKMMRNGEDGDRHSRGPTFPMTYPERTVAKRRCPYHPDTILVVRAGELWMPESRGYWCPECRQIITFPPARKP